MKKQTPQILLFPLLFLFLSLSLLMTGCNTVRGFGEDITGSSNFVQKKMFGGDDSSMPINNSANPPQWPK
ncbi:MAG: hypothetical protein K2W99_05160 [Chthoniobacterales bacterium]|nr:hypothetical protein [Chthoniobacterales bacterium]